MEKIVLRHGTPQQLLTDQGTNLVSRLMKETCRILNIRKLTTTAYHPESNGAVERLNKTLKGLVSHLVSRDQRDWDLWIPYVLFSYNTAEHESTNKTPFFLCHGRDPRLPHEILDAPRVPNYGTLNDFKSELALRLQAAHDLAGEALRCSQERRKTLYDHGSRNPDFREGDRVYLDVRYPGRGLSQKLGPKWRGPYQVVKLATPVTIRVKELATGAESTVHVNRLKLAIDDALLASSGAPLADGFPAPSCTALDDSLPRSRTDGTDTTKGESGLDIPPETWEMLEQALTPPMLEVPGAASGPEIQTACVRPSSSGEIVVEKEIWEMCYPSGGDPVAVHLSGRKLLACLSVYAPDWFYKFLSVHIDVNS